MKTFSKKDFDIALAEYNKKHVLKRMNIFEDIVIDEDQTMSFEDYSDMLEFSNDRPVHWKNCKNNMLILEDSLQRTLSFIKTQTFAVFSAYRKTNSKTNKAFTKKENIERNRKLRAFLNFHRMGVHQLVGHWNETQVDGTKIDVVERSYLVCKPDDISDKDFCNIVIACLTIDGETQDGALISFKSKSNDVYFLDAKNQALSFVGNHLTIGNKAKLATAYSQHVKKMNTPFTFDGIETPDSNIGKQMYQEAGFKI